MWIVFYVAMAASLSAMVNLMQTEKDKQQEPYSDM